MWKFIVGLIVGLLLVPIGAFWAAHAGWIPVATSSHPLPLETSLAQAALHARLRREAPASSPISASAANLAAGAVIFRMECSVCHGLPGQPPSDQARGMFPSPPQLFTAKEMVTDDPVGVVYWKAKNGIRLSGMPGFHAALTDQQLWQVALLLVHADRLPPAVRGKLASANQ